MKRTFDLTAAGLGLLILSPLLLAIALLVRALDGSPVLFRQRRVGYQGVEFSMLKFRTMSCNNGATPSTLTIGDDPRITRLGRQLRRLKLDELPQLVNVWRGDMSLVGPRPETSEYVRLYTDDQRRVLRLRPGITDVASIRFRRESELLGAAADPQNAYVRDIMPQKIELSLQYAQRANVWRDMGVILQTIFRLAA